MSEWQPIETAPESMTSVLLFWPNNLGIEKQTVGWWYEGEFCDESNSEEYGQPSHWMPLPAPPAA
jgi:hypothetical protein